MGTGTAGTAVTLSGAGAFSGASDYVCYGSDTSNPGLNVVFTYGSGTAFTPLTTSAGDGVKFICIGVTAPS